MTAPKLVSAPLSGVYDEVEGVCRLEPILAEAPVCMAPEAPEVASVDRYESVSRSQILAEAFGASRPVARNWGSPLAYSAWSLLSGPVACSGPTEPVEPGDPLRSASPQGGPITMNPQPLRGNLNEYDLSGGGSHTAVAWSVFNSTTPAETGTFAFVRDGAAAGSVVTASNDASALHLFTTSATLDDGSTIVAYTKATGEDEPSSIVARSISPTGTVGSTEITILASGVRGTLPDAQLVSTGTGFIAVYRDGDGHLKAAAFNASGVAQGAPQDLGTAPSKFAVNRDESGNWILAEIVSDTEIRVRNFAGLRNDGIDRRISTGGFPSSPNLSVAMQEGGTVMVAWNKAGGGIMGAVLNGEGDTSGAPFEVRSSGLANTMSLASDHRGNFVFAWEEAGAVLARVYNGTPSFTTPADFSTISTGNSNSNVQAHVSDSGRLTISWVNSSTSGGDTLQDLIRREYQLNY